MAGRFVRASKYRHVYGQPTKKEQCYDNLRISRNAWDTNLIKANPEYLSVNWEASGGGAFAVIPINERGKLPERMPLFRGHTAAVLDTDWNPFDDHLLASASDDGKVFLWRVPDNFTLLTDSEDPADVAPVGRLAGHARKVGHVLFNPSAQNVLASSSGDFTIKVWDIEQGKDRLVLKHAEIVQSLSWNAQGSLLVTTSRDKKLRIWDVRQEKPAQEVAGHSGAKNSRAVWLGDSDRVATTGFSKMSDRQLGLWDIKNPGAPINDFLQLDSISGVCMPFWDDGNKIIYLAGKGDGNIRYFELANDKFEYLSEYKSADPQRGIAFVPKRGVNVHENEIARAYKTISDTYIEPISFVVPRRAEVFQTDIYPPTVGLKSAMSSGEYFSGKTAMPPLISLRGRYDGGEGTTELTAEEKAMVTSPPTTASTTTASKPAPEVETPKFPMKTAAPAPTPATSAPKAEIKDTKNAMSAAADKFADKDEESEDDDSSFEEIPKPVERHTKTEPPKPTPAAVPSIARSTPTIAKPTPMPAPIASIAESTPEPPKSTGGPAEALKNHLAEIKSAQAKHSTEISEIKDLIKVLNNKLDSLVDSHAERIRSIELEIEGLRE